eukprot:TRINITY_DN1054_c0_g1_i1.p1 TRINITY_DN1054_c0_g1~~TRINITY_DN1054_c0_g1_i1.p1  ORF type:complete len:219 (-),score=9.44 TRINITY_DN1054_c0_g1_i1:142-705(-)
MARSKALESKAAKSAYRAELKDALSSRRKGKSSDLFPTLQSLGRKPPSAAVAAINEAQKGNMPSSEVVDDLMAREPLAGSSNDTIDTLPLSDKERVLRLLFEKINAAEAVKQPPTSNPPAPRTPQPDSPTSRAPSRSALRSSRLGSSLSEAEPSQQDRTQTESKYDRPESHKSERSVVLPPVMLPSM